MAVQRLIVAIGRVERALSRMEQLPAINTLQAGVELEKRHEILKTETRAAIADIDRLLAGAA